MIMLPPLVPQGSRTATFTLRGRAAARRTRPCRAPGHARADLPGDAARHGEHGVSLEGPVRGVANRHTGAAQGFAQRDFTIDWERERVTCPRGKASVTWRAGLDEVGAARIQAVFSRTDCGACAARELCTPAKAGR